MNSRSLTNKFMQRIFDFKWFALIPHIPLLQTLTEKYDCEADKSRQRLPCLQLRRVRATRATVDRFGFSIYCRKIMSNRFVVWPGQAPAPFDNFNGFIFVCLHFPLYDIRPPLSRVNYQPSACCAFGVFGGVVHSPSSFSRTFCEDYTVMHLP